MDGKGYKLPEVIDPEGYQCFKVYVPDDTLYLAAFWRTYELFASWFSWERDAAHRGKDAAAVWRVAFEMARDAYSTGEGCDVEIVLRQNPANKCQLQQSHDGGETWALAFDYTLCGGALLTVPPYDGSPSGPSDAAAAAVANTFQALVSLAGDCSMTRSEYIAAATAYMRVFDPSYSAPGALGGVYDAYCALDPTAQEEAAEDCSYEPLKEELENCYDAGGLLNDLDCLSQAISDWLQDANDELMESLTVAAAALSGDGWQAASGDGAGGGGGGFGGGEAFAAECGWCHEFDFTVDDYETFPHAGIEITSGRYTAGGYANNGTGSPEAIKFRYTFDGLYTIRKMVFEFASSGGIHHDSEHCRSNTQHGTWAGGPFTVDGLDPRIHYVHEGGGVIDKSREGLATGYVEIEIWGYSDELATTWPDITVTKWKICGEGADPFV